jgi:hypothetical protein
VFDKPGVCIWAAGMQGFESADMQGRLPRVELSTGRL